MRPCGEGVLVEQGVHTAERLIWSPFIWLGWARLVRATVLVVLMGCCPIMGLFALLCHRQLDTGIAYSDTSCGRVLPPRC